MKSHPLLLDEPVNLVLLILASLVHALYGTMGLMWKQEGLSGLIGRYAILIGGVHSLK